MKFQKLSQFLHSWLYLSERMVKKLYKHQVLTTPLSYLSLSSPMYTYNVHALIHLLFFLLLNCRFMLVCFSTYFASWDIEPKKVEGFFFLTALPRNTTQLVGEEANDERIVPWTWESTCYGLISLCLKEEVASEA